MPMKGNDSVLDRIETLEKATKILNRRLNRFDDFIREGLKAMEEKKVYCKGCRWVGQNIVMPGNDCKHKKNKRDTAYEQIQEFIDICNANNDCKLYEKEPGSDIAER